jgi:DNA-directed RNA polymerase specialized sigma24 family protein
MSEEITFDQHKKIINYLARRIKRRLSAVKAHSITYEDIVQELSVAWCIARNSWDQKLGVPFVPYLRRGMYNHINRWVEREKLQRLIAPCDLDADSNDAQLHEILADEYNVPADERLIRENIRSTIIDRLSPRAKMFVDMLESPPPEIMTEFNAVRQRAAYGRERGLKSIAPKTIAASLIMDLMGCSYAERHSIYAEIRSVTELVVCE